ncbi:MAG: orotidine-5'-phosphate decarboxylase [Dehalococcoidia bacterium]|nr:orotidine-5'-phosphate decarboxylase [Dehalococcoidia bacterium]
MGISMTGFHTKLNKATTKNNSLLCIGLDPDPNLLPIKDIALFNKEIIDATKDLVCCYKPNLAFYESLGMDGLQALEQTIAYIPSDIPIIGDAKRGDIGSTAHAYAKALFDVWQFDAVTVNPYLGKDSLDPFIDYKEKGVFVLCHTSNPGASDFQELTIQADQNSYALFQHIARKAETWNVHGNISLVVGATYPEQLKLVRDICPDMTILAPGIGAQGGDLKGTIQYGVSNDGAGLIINSSRGIIYASKEKNDFSTMARKAADQLRTNINLYR